MHRIALVASAILATALVLSSAGGLAPNPADGQEHGYVGSGDQGGQCSAANLGLGIGLGLVCLPGGHVQPDTEGFAIVVIEDTLNTPVSGFICQDSVGDGCIHVNFGELGIPFCGSVAIATPSAGGRWDPSLDLLVFIDGPVFGNPAVSPCGTLSAGFGGHVSHS
jgi:hypothetical protein